MQKLPEGPAKQSAFQSLSAPWAEADPQGAAAAAQSLPGGDAQNTLIDRVANHWAMEDPKATAAWANQFPEGEPRNRALSGLAAGWAWGYGLIPALQGPIAKATHDIDISWLVGFGVAAGLYFFLRPFLSKESQVAREDTHKEQTT